ncbi:hypothetical protein QJS66_02650 [Kocuria rhizophila]|nr:hypothetical protein QJS66_02650 [Kocuria rhizophila]
MIFFITSIDPAGHGRHGQRARGRGAAAAADLLDARGGAVCMAIVVTSGENGLNALQGGHHRDRRSRDGSGSAAGRDAAQGPSPGRGHRPAACEPGSGSASCPRRSTTAGAGHVGGVQYVLLEYEVARNRVERYHSASGTWHGSASRRGARLSSSPPVAPSAASAPPTVFQGARSGHARSADAAGVLLEPGTQTRAEADRLRVVSGPGCAAADDLEAVASADGG